MRIANRVLLWSLLPFCGGGAFFTGKAVESAHLRAAIDESKREAVLDSRIKITHWPNRFLNNDNEPVSSLQDHGLTGNELAYYRH